MEHHTQPSEQQQERVKKLKALEAEVLSVLGSFAGSADGRWCAVAKTHFEEGVMAATRAVMNPPPPVQKPVVQ